MVRDFGTAFTPEVWPAGRISSSQAAEPPSLCMAASGIATKVVDSPQRLRRAQSSGPTSSRPMLSAMLRFRKHCSQLDGALQSCGSARCALVASNRPRSIRSLCGSIPKLRHSSWRCPDFSARDEATRLCLVTEINRRGN
jgi:hypothetical protein